MPNGLVLHSHKVTWALIGLQCFCILPGTCTNAGLLVMFHTRQSMVKLSLHAVISIAARLNEGAQTLCHLNLETRIGLPHVT
jgi:hypothetical protein